HDADVSDLNSGAFDAAYLGHYHMPQLLAPNVRYIGAPLQHNWGDEQQARGFRIYDTETQTDTRYDLKAPRFEQTTIEEYVQHKDDFINRWARGNYVRIVDPRPWSDDEREDLRTRSGALSLEIIPPKSAVKVDRGPRLDVTPGMSFQDAV